MIFNYYLEVFTNATTTNALGYFPLSHNGFTQKVIYPSLTSVEFFVTETTPVYVAQIVRLRKQNNKKSF